MKVYETKSIEIELELEASENTDDYYCQYERHSKIYLSNYFLAKLENLFLGWEVREVTLESFDILRINLRKEIEQK
jgi:hypothetical protein